MATGDLIITEDRLAIGATENLSTFTVQARLPFPLTGTVTASETAVTGIGTSFLMELVVGDSIGIDDGSCDHTRAVTAIASDTELTVDRPFWVDLTGQAVEVRPSAIRVDDGDGAAQVIVNHRGNIGIGTTAPNAQLEISGEGAGEFGMRPANLLLHTTGCSFNLAMSTDSPEGTKPGVAMWVEDFVGDGAATLSYSFYNGVDTMVDVMRLDTDTLLLQVGLKASPNLVTTNHTISPGDYQILVNAGVSGITITLPNSSASNGQMVSIFKKAGAGDVTITPDAGVNLNGATASKTISTLYSGIQLIADHDTWIAVTLPAA